MKISKIIPRKTTIKVIKDNPNECSVFCKYESNIDGISSCSMYECDLINEIETINKGNRVLHIARCQDCINDFGVNND